MNHSPPHSHCTACQHVSLFKGPPPALLPASPVHDKLTPTTIIHPDNRQIETSTHLVALTRLSPPSPIDQECQAQQIPQTTTPLPWIPRRIVSEPKASRKAARSLDLRHPTEE